MKTLDTWFFDGTVEKRPGAPNKIPPDAFQLRITKPSAANTGPRIPEINLVNYAGSFSNAPAGGPPISGLAITGQINATNPNVTFQDCLVKMGANSNPGTTYLGIKANNASQPTGLRFEFCEIRPSVQSVDHYGIQGRGFVLYRCEISGVVDGGVLHGSGTNGTASVQGCFIHGLAHYDVDPRQSGTPSHDDGLQIEGLLDVEVIGNTILGGYTSAILVTQNVGTFARVSIEDNWLDQEHPAGGAVVNVSEKSLGPINNFTLARNKFGRTGTGYRIIMPSTTRLASTSYVPLTGPDANVYENDGTPVTITNG